MPEQPPIKRYFLDVEVISDDPNETGIPEFGVTGSCDVAGREVSETVVPDDNHEKVTWEDVSSHEEQVKATICDDCDGCAIQLVTLSRKRFPASDDIETVEDAIVELLEAKTDSDMSESARAVAGSLLLEILGLSILIKTVSGFIYYTSFNSSVECFENTVSYLHILSGIIINILSTWPIHHLIRSNGTYSSWHTDDNL